MGKFVVYIFLCACIEKCTRFLISYRLASFMRHQVKIDRQVIKNVSFLNCYFQEMYYHNMDAFGLTLDELALANDLAIV